MYPFHVQKWFLSPKLVNSSIAFERALTAVESHAVPHYGFAWHLLRQRQGLLDRAVTFSIIPQQGEYRLHHVLQQTLSHQRQ